MAEPIDMIVPLLQDMRAEIKFGFQGNADRFKAIEARLEKIEQAQVSFKYALTADSLLSKLVTGEFEDRIEKLETKMREFEGRS